jgi:transcriptional regulator with XRE-family HTH domain
MRKTTLKELSEETGIPRTSLNWLLNDSNNRRDMSILRKTAADCGFDYVLFKGWTGKAGHDEPRLILDVERLSFYDRAIRLDYNSNLATIDFAR